MGLGTGVWGDRKKVSADSWSGIFRAEDRLRPPALATYDLRGSPSAFAEALSTGRIDSSLLAADADNDWTDGAVVDAHAYAGWTYDYYFKRHQRRGLDGLDLATRSVTHFLPRSWGFANAFWDPFSSAMYYGDGDARGLRGRVRRPQRGVLRRHGHRCRVLPPARRRRPAARRLLPRRGPDLAFRPFADRGALDGEPLALLLGLARPVRPGPLLPRYRGEADNGGVHHNSGVANQAFFLLAEGGVNRTSGRRVGGPGPGGREKAERIFYRGFTAYLTPSATFRDARAATVRVARDLHGEAEAAETASAWSAVGIE